MKKVAKPTDRMDKHKKGHTKLKIDAKKLGHVESYKEAGYMSDQYVCSCGWESNIFWDGEGYAYDEWLQHAKVIIDDGQYRLVLR